MRGQSHGGEVRTSAATPLLHLHLRFHLRPARRRSRHATLRAACAALPPPSSTPHRTFALTASLALLLSCARSVCDPASRTRPAPTAKSPALPYTP